MTKSNKLISSNVVYFSWIQSVLSPESVYFIFLLLCRNQILYSRQNLAIGWASIYWRSIQLASCGFAPLSRMISGHPGLGNLMYYVGIKWLNSWLKILKENYVFFMEPKQNSLVCLHIMGIPIKKEVFSAESLNWDSLDSACLSSTYLIISS